MNPPIFAPSIAPPVPPAKDVISLVKSLYFPLAKSEIAPAAETTRSKKVNFLDNCFPISATAWVFICALVPPFQPLL